MLFFLFRCRDALDAKPTPSFLLVSASLQTNLPSPPLFRIASYRGATRRGEWGNPTDSAALRSACWLALLPTRPRDGPTAPAGSPRAGPTRPHRCGAPRAGLPGRWRRAPSSWGRALIPVQRPFWEKGNRSGAGPAPAAPSRISPTPEGRRMTSGGRRVGWLAPGGARNNEAGAWRGQLGRRRLASSCA